MWINWWSWKSWHNLHNWEHLRKRQAHPLFRYWLDAWKYITKLARLIRLEMLAQGAYRPCLIDVLLWVDSYITLDATNRRYIWPQMAYSLCRRPLPRSLLLYSLCTGHLLPCCYYLFVGLLRINPHERSLPLLDGTYAKQKSKLHRHFLELFWGQHQPVCNSLFHESKHRLVWLCQVWTVFPDLCLLHDLVHSRVSYLFAKERKSRRTEKCTNVNC